MLLGHSVQGRPIRAVELGDPGAQRKVLVVGCVHGNETAGITVAHAVDRAKPRRLDVWVVDDLNPDGVAAHTRQNAHGVDLNRNFPWRWRPLGRRGDQQYSGQVPLSEPESRIAHSLILRLRPAVAVWFHQPLGLVDESGGDVAVERRFSRLTGLPPRRLARYPGSAVGWENHLVPGGTAFVAELPARPVTPRQADRYAHAILRVGI